MKWAWSARYWRNLPFFATNKTRVVAAILAVFTLAFFVILALAWRKQTQAPLTCQVGFAPLKESNGYVEIQLKTQNPQEPAFDGTVFVLLKDEEYDGKRLEHLVVNRSATGSYGSSRYQLRMVWDEAVSKAWRSKDFEAFSLISTGRTHQWFPFDEGRFDFRMDFEPPVRPAVIRVVNRVPGFDLLCSDLGATKAGDSYRVSLRLRRSPLIPFVTLVLAFCALVFLVLIPRLQKIETVAAAATSFFFSQWSIRQIMASHVRVFPTILDCGILTLCVLMTASLLWKSAYHWMSREQERLISLPPPQDPPAELTRARPRR